MEKLVSMTDFVMQQNMHYANKDITVEKLQLSILNYAMFLKQPLTLGMFVPCKLVGGVWVVLEEPTHLQKMQAGWADNPLDDNFYMVKEYQEAKERVLFEGFEVFKSVSDLISFSKNGLGRLDWNIEGGFMMGYSKESTIEDLYNSHYVDLTLTPTAQKQIGL